MSSSTGTKTAEEVMTWVQRVHEKQSQRSPEALEAARQRVEEARQHEMSYRNCKAVKGHAVRSRGLALESLRQMSAVTAPAAYAEVQQRWSHAQEASVSRVQNAFRTPVAALSREVEEPLQDADAEELEALSEATRMIGAVDANVIAVAGTEDSQMEVSLGQLRTEPSDDTEMAAKFQLYEGYSSQVEQMRKTLLDFHKETRTTVPPAVAQDMDQKVGSIDSREAMGIFDEAREWFVFQMMQKAQKNNLTMAKILEGFEATLKFLLQNDQQECPVCLESFEQNGPHSPETLSCCHKVCTDCWAHWKAAMHGRPFCPLCRNDEFLGAVAQQVSSPA